MQEIWKDIDGYEGYQVSNLGRVRTHNKITYTEKHGIRHWKNRILKLKTNKRDKALRVELWKNGKHKTMLVHRLVANTFLEPNINTVLTVNHKNGNRQDNRVDNLEWVSLADNIRHAFNTGLHSCNIKIKITNKNNGYDKTYRSMNEASKAIGKNPGYISAKVLNNIYEDNNFVWEII